jgi:hypothetical protein
MLLSLHLIRSITQQPDLQQGRGQLVLMFAEGNGQDGNIKIVVLVLISFQMARYYFY